MSLSLSSCQGREVVGSACRGREYEKINNTRQVVMDDDNNNNDGQQGPPGR